jgi:putative ABC transport system permease protein
MNVGVPPELSLRGVDLDTTTIDPVPLTLREPSTGTEIRVTVIGVLSDATPYEFVAGVNVAQAALAPLGDRARPSIHYLSVAPGVDPDAAATRLESAFLANGMQAESIRSILETAVGGTRTFIRLIQGFMALGLLVGVAALGVISARSVVERRQQIGVLRAIGFQPEMVRRTLLLESSFVAVSAVLIGTGLGLVMGYNVIADAREQPSWAGIALTVPWVNLGVIFGSVVLAALATTFLPAIRASRVYPAEALRYQ